VRFLVRDRARVMPLGPSRGKAISAPGRGGGSPQRRPLGWGDVTAVYDSAGPSATASMCPH